MYGRETVTSDSVKDISAWLTTEIMIVLNIMGAVIAIKLWTGIILSFLGGW